MQEKLFCIKCNTAVGDYFPGFGLYRARKNSKYPPSKSFLGLPAQFLCSLGHNQWELDVDDFKEGGKIHCAVCENDLGEYCLNGKTKGIMINHRYISDEMAKIVIVQCAKCNEPYNLEKLRKEGKSIGVIFQPENDQEVDK